MRKKAVGLLGNMAGGRRPSRSSRTRPYRAARRLHRRVPRRPRPPRARLRHVRPCRCRRAPCPPRHRHDRPGAGPLIREISDEVVALTRKWRRAYGASMARACAPSTRLPSSARSIPACSRSRPPSTPRPAQSRQDRGTGRGRLLRIDEVPTRGGRERVIPPGVRESYDNALHCNGNGACYDFDLDAAMCPSWKGTRERRHSPKGRPRSCASGCG